MYFKISKLHSWRKRAGQVRRHNCAVLPFQSFSQETVETVEKTMYNVGW